jgi:hypothetical protein
VRAEGFEICDGEAMRLDAYLDRRAAVADQGLAR